MMFYVAVPLAGTNYRSGLPQHDVAVAMEPYRGDKWTWYAIASLNHTRTDTPTFAVIGTDGNWYSNSEPNSALVVPLWDWDTELKREFWDRISEHEQVVRLRCKN